MRGTHRGGGNIMYVLIIVLCFLLMIIIEVYREAFEDVYVSPKKELLYNLGDLLNMPRFNLTGISDPVKGLTWESGKHRNIEDYNAVCEYFTDSILAEYCKLHTNPDEAYPNLEKIRAAVDTYCDRHTEEVPWKKIKKDNVLVVHLRSGDYGEVDDTFITSLNKVCVKYQELYILCGIHTSLNKNKDIDNDVKTLQKSIEKVKDKLRNKNITVANHPPDIDICIMRNCSNLMVHMGGFSTIGLFVFRGKNLYCSPSFPYPEHPLTETHRRNTLVEIQLI